MAFTTARVNAAVDAALGATVYGQLHTGDPGAGGTNNVSAVTGREQFSFPAASNEETSDDAVFAVSGATSALSHFTLWDAASNGNLIASGECSPAESFAGSGTLTVTVTVTGSSA